MLSDFRHAFRLLTRQRGFTLIALLALALGSGTNSAMFALVNALLYRPLPAHDPGRLRFIYLTDPGVPGEVSGMRYDDYLGIQQRHDLFTDVLARGTDRAQITAGGDVRHARGEMVSSNYFEVLGVAPALGRTLTPADDQAVAEPVAVISTGMWKARFNRDPAVLGTPLQIDQRAYTIVGVMPDAFRGTLGTWEQSQYWVPLRQRTVDMLCRRPEAVGDRAVAVVGRLQNSVSAIEAQAALAGLRLPPTSVPPGATPANRLWTPALFEAGRSSLPFDSFGRVVPERFALGLMTLAGLVLLIAAANLSGMLAARGVSRQGELATRIALGAGRWRLGRQLLTENLVLALLGGVLGLLLARWALAAFVAAVPAQFSRFDLSHAGAAQVLAIDAPIDWRVILYTMCVCLLTGVFVGIGPALRAGRSGVLGALTSTAMSTPRRAVRQLRHWIIVPQICLSLGLLLVAGLIVSSLTRLETVEHGYNPERLVAVGFDLPTARPCDRRELSAPELRAYREFQRDAYRRIRTAAGAIEGVSAVSLSHALPLETPRAGGTWITGRERVSGTIPSTYISKLEVTPGYFQLMGIPLLNGRDFTELDAAENPQVVVVSDRLARTLWAGGNPIGQQVAFQEVSSSRPPRWFEVIGIAGDVSSPLGGDEYQRPAAYVPLGTSGYARTVIATGSLPAAQMLRELKRAITKAAPGAQVADGGRVVDGIASYLYPRRIAAAILATAGMVALLLASVGIYGVVSYSVAQRTRELGVRRALGADGRDIIGLIVREGARVAVVGAALGLLFGYVAVRLTSSRLVALPSFDVATLLGAPALLAIVVLIACYIPARRASRVDPMVALREL